MGTPPPIGTTKEEKLEWLKFQKRKWAHQAQQRAQHQKSKKSKNDTSNEDQVSWGVARNTNTSTLGGFLRRAQKKLLVSPWQIIQVRMCFFKR